MALLGQSGQKRSLRLSRAPDDWLHTSLQKAEVDWTVYRSKKKSKEYRELGDSNFPIPFDTAALSAAP